MILYELVEDSVNSSWIMDLTSTGKHATMSLNNGAVYQILDIDPAIYDRWINSPSKGNFYNTQVRDGHTVNRIQ